MTRICRDPAGRFLNGHASPGPGRGTLYHEGLNDLARRLALLGLTDEQIAAFFEIDVRTLDRWKLRHPAFCRSLMEGKTIADANVADALYRRATGQLIEIEQTWQRTGDGRQRLVAMKSFRPADTGAAKLWLINRRRQNWRASPAFQSRAK